MINLLPPELKEQYVYGRRNVTLRRWAIALAFGLAGVALITFGGLLVMQRSITTYQSQVASTKDSLKKQDLNGTRTEVKDITDNIKLAVDVLSNEILFSKLISQIGSVMPPDTTLTDLSISSDQNAIDLKAQAMDYGSATQIQVNLQDPDNKIFSRADIQSINCAAQSENKYPCQVTLKALFTPNNPFLLIQKRAQ